MALASASALPTESGISLELAHRIPHFRNVGSSRESDQWGIVASNYRVMLATCRTDRGC
jgi:hypothetical protein